MRIPSLRFSYDVIPRACKWNAQLLHQPDYKGSELVKVVIVDDERLAIVRLERLLESREEVEIVGTFTRQAQLLEEFPQLQPDVAFLDIDMPGLNGLELATSLLEMNEDLEIVFVTAYDQFALEAFRVNAVDYLLKPIDERTLANTLHRINRRGTRRNTGTRKPALHIQCFGDYTVVGQGDRGPVSFPTAKTEELLAFFLVHRETNVSKWMICESLWPEHEPQKAEQNLHTTVFRLKKTLLDSRIRFKLSSRKGHYYFLLEDSCDYIRFDELAKEGKAVLAQSPAEMELVLRLYKGPLFGYKDYPWCEAARERASQSFRELTKALARLYMTAGEYKPAHDLLQYLLTIIPYEEEAHELTLRIYVYWKDRTSFHMHSNKMKAMLKREMGIDPPAFMETLMQEIMKD
ncbi:Transcriptional regulatory protein YehT [compost metagenome]